MEKNKLSSYERWIARHNLDTRNTDTKDLWLQYNIIISSINKKKAVEIGIKSKTNVQALVLAMKDVASKTRKSLGMVLYNNKGKPTISNINENTIRHLERIIYDDDYESSFTDVDIVRSIRNVSKVRIEFLKRLPEDKKRKERKSYNLFKPIPTLIDDNLDIPEQDTTAILKSLRGGKYFPYINKLKDLDLSKYGIYHNISHPKINQSCFITAMESNNIFTKDEINTLKSFIHTREVWKKDLEQIAETFDIQIKLAYKYFLPPKENHSGFISEKYGQLILSSKHIW
jgi:hypothetical protein